MTNENNINPLIFRAYDIRGIVGEDLTEETVELIGKGIGTFLLGTMLKSFLLEEM